MPIYRAVPRNGFDERKTYRRHATARLPGNVSYLVDNIWEHTRLEEVVARRHAVYASPTPELARVGATAAGRPASDFTVCEVIFDKPARVFQLSVADARHHPDVPALQKLVNIWLADHANATMAQRLASALLFMPGTTRAELAAAMKLNGPLADIVGHCVAASTMWRDAPDPLKGEITFELDPDNSYALRPV